MPTVYQRAAAQRDLVEHFVYLAENTGLKTADRFLANAEVSFDTLATQPLIGTEVRSRHPALVGMRRWRVKEFDSYLIFYLPRPDGVSIVRVLYGTRDWWDLLGFVG